MPDDRRGTPRPHLITDDRARAHDQRQAIPIHREDDTVPLGRPPGVPVEQLTPGAMRLIGEAAEAFALTFGDEPPMYALSTEGGVVRVSIEARVDVAALNRLAASLDGLKEG